MNSILDLSHEFGEGQSLLFDEEQWATLEAKFPIVNKEDEEVEYNLQDLTDNLRSKVENLAVIKSSFEKKLEKLSSWLEREEKKKLSGDETFAIFLLKHILKLYKKSAYLFQSDIDCSEWDFIIKIWSPLIKELFIDANLRSKWGDTVCKVGNEDGTTDLEIDLRILLDKTTQRFNVKHDLSSGEFAKYDPGRLKYQADRCKLMIEGKRIINNIIANGLDFKSVPMLKICGTELTFLEVSLVVPGFYVGNEITSFSFFNKIENFSILPDLTRNLILFRNNCLGIACTLEDHMKTKERAKGTKY